MAGKPERVPFAPVAPAAPAEPPAQSSQAPLQNVILYVSENFPQTYMTQQNVDCHQEAYPVSQANGGYINSSVSSAASMTTSTHPGLKHVKAQQEFIANGFQNNSGGFYHRNSPAGGGQAAHNNAFLPCQVPPGTPNNFAYTSNGNAVSEHGFNGIKCSSDGPNGDPLGVYSLSRGPLPPHHMEPKQEALEHQEGNFMAVMGGELSSGRCDSVRSDAAESSCSSLSSAECQPDAGVAVLVQSGQQQSFQSGQNGFIGQNSNLLQNSNGGHQQVLVNANPPGQQQHHAVQHYAPPNENQIQIGNGVPNHSHFPQPGVDTRLVGAASHPQKPPQLIAAARPPQQQLQQQQLQQQLQHQQLQLQQHQQQQQQQQLCGSNKQLHQAVPTSVTTSVHQFVTTVAGNQKLTSSLGANSCAVVTAQQGSDDAAVVNSSRVHQSAASTEPAGPAEPQAAPGSVVLVPFGWKRLQNNGSVFYVSPSSAALGSLDQVREYLTTQGTCKCGLDCPLRPEAVFNFDPKVSGRPSSAPAGDLTGLCNHKRKLVGMGSLATGSGSGGGPGGGASLAMHRKPAGLQDGAAGAASATAAPIQGWDEEASPRPQDGQMAQSCNPTSSGLPSCNQMVSSSSSQVISQLAQRHLVSAPVTPSQIAARQNPHAQAQIAQSHLGQHVDGYLGPMCQPGFYAPPHQARSGAPCMHMQHLHHQQGFQQHMAHQEIPQQMPQLLPLQTPQQIPQQAAQQMPLQTQQIPLQTPQQIPQQTPQQTPQQMPQQTPQQIPHLVPQQMPQQTTLQMPQHAPQQVHQTSLQMPQQAPQQMPHQTPQHMPHHLSQQTPPQISQQTSHLIPQQTSHLIPQQSPQPLPQPTPQQISQQPAQQLPQHLNPQTPHQIPQQIQRIPQQVPQQIPQLIPQIPHQIPQKTPQHLPQQTPQQGAQTTSLQQGIQQGFPNVDQHTLSHTNQQGTQRINLQGHLNQQGHQQHTNQHVNHQQGLQHANQHGLQNVPQQVIQQGQQLPEQTLHPLSQQHSVQHVAQQGPQHVPQSQGPQHVPQPQGPQHVPQPQGPQHIPQSQGPQHVPQPQGPQHVPQPQGPQHVPQPQGPQHVPQPQGPQHVPHPQGPQHAPQQTQQRVPQQYHQIFPAQPQHGRPAGEAATSNQMYRVATQQQPLVHQQVNQHPLRSRPAPPWQQARLQRQAAGPPALVPAAPASPADERVPPLHQHVHTQPTWKEEPALLSIPRKRNNRSGSKAPGSRKGRTPYIEPRTAAGLRSTQVAPCPNVDVRHLPQEARPSFLEDPGAYLAQQTAMLQNTISQQACVVPQSPSGTYKPLTGLGRPANPTATSNLMLGQASSAHNFIPVSWSSSASPVSSRQAPSQSSSQTPSPYHTPSPTPFQVPTPNASPSQSSGPHSVPSAAPSPHSTTSRQPDSSVVSPDRCLQRPHSVEDNPVTSSTYSDVKEATDGSESEQCSSNSSSVRSLMSPNESTIADSQLDPLKVKNEEACSTSRKVTKVPVSKRAPAGPIQGGTVSTSNGFGRHTPQAETCPTSSVSPRPSSCQSPQVTVSNAGLTKAAVSVKIAHRSPKQQVQTTLAQTSSNRAILPQGCQGQAHAQVTTMASGHTVSSNTITSVLAGRAPTATVTVSASSTPPAPPCSTPLPHQPMATIQISKSPMDVVQNIVNSIQLNVPLQPHQLQQLQQQVQQQVQQQQQSHSQIQVQQAGQTLQLSQQLTQQGQQLHQQGQHQAQQQSQSHVVHQNPHIQIQAQHSQAQVQHSQNQQQAAPATVMMKAQPAAPGHAGHAGLQAHHILVSSGGQLLVASSAKPAMPPLSVSPLVTSVTAAMTQVIPAVGMVQQAQPVQLGSMVLNALNALQGPLVLPGVGSVIGVDGLTQNATMQIPQLTVSNVVQNDSRNFLSQQQTAALLSPPDSGAKKKNSNKKRKPATQAVTLQITAPSQHTPNIAPAFSSPSSASFGGTPLLTLVPGKSPCTPPQIVVNHAAAHSPNTQSQQQNQSQPSSQQSAPTLGSSQPLASPGHINLLQPVGVMTAPLQQFIVPGLVMATDGSGNTTLIQDPVGSLTNIQNISNVQTIPNIQNVQNMGVQLQLQNVNGQNVLTPVQTPMQVHQGASGIVFQRSPSGSAPKLTTAQFISSPTNSTQFIIPTSSTGTKQQFLSSPTGSTQFLIPTSSSQGTQLIATSSPGGGTQFLTTAAAFGNQLNGQLSPLLASLSPNGQLSGQHITLSTTTGQTIQMATGQLGGQTLVVPCAPAAPPPSLSGQRPKQEIQIAVSLAQLHQVDQQKHIQSQQLQALHQHPCSSNSTRKSGPATITLSVSGSSSDTVSPNRPADKVGTSTSAVKQSVSTQTLQRQSASTAANIVTTTTTTAPSRSGARCGVRGGGGLGGGREVVTSPSTTISSGSSGSVSGIPPDTTTLSPVGGGGVTPQHSPNADTTSSVDDVRCSSTRSAAASPASSPPSASPHHRQITTPSSLAMVHCVSSSNADPETNDSEWNSVEKQKPHSSSTSPSISRSDNYFCEARKSIGSDGFVESSSNIYSSQNQSHSHQQIVYTFGDVSLNRSSLKRKHSIGDDVFPANLHQLSQGQMSQRNQQLQNSDECGNAEGSVGSGLAEGDLVWGPARGFPAWPGQLVACPEGSPRPGPGHVWVHWFSGGGSGVGGDRSISLVSRESLKSLSEGLETHHHAIKKFRKGRKMNIQLENAIQEAMAALDKLSETQKQDGQEGSLKITGISENNKLLQRNIQQLPQKGRVSHSTSKRHGTQQQKADASSPATGLRSTRFLISGSHSQSHSAAAPPPTRLRRSQR